MDQGKQTLRKRIALSLLMLGIIFVAVFLLSAGNLFAAEEEVQSTKDQNAEYGKTDVMKFKVIAAAVAFGFGAIGAGIAIAHVGAAAMGAIGEKPEIAGQALIFIALAEGLVVFGFITALMILGQQ